MKPVILVLENPGNNQEEFLELAGRSTDKYTFVTSINNISCTDIIGIVHVKRKLSGEFLTDFPNLKFIATAFTGYDSVDEHYCRNHKIAVYNVPEYSTDSVAELTIALAISLLRRIPQGAQIIQNGGWETVPGLELSNRTVAIIGTGAIGCRVATLFKAFGCEIRGWSRTRKEAFSSIGGKYFSSISEAVKDAEIVSIHLPSNENTKGIFNTKELKAMKPEALLINTARGPVIDEKALIEALDKKSIGGAALDVYDTEPLPETHPFRSMDNVLALPHIAFKTKEALYRKAQITVENIIAFAENSSKNRVI